MAEKQKRDETLQKNLAHLKKRALDVKFDLDTTEYTPIENIGIGAYGVVCSAIHKKTNDRVAIKKIPGVFDYKDIAKRTYREIKILKHFSHDNVIHIREILKPKETLDDFRDIYVVFDLMESDLHKIIYSKQELTEEHARYFLYQILRGLKYIHSADVIHRDLKPSNLLVNEDCQLRIGDFGMARGISSSSAEPNYFMTQYVATRWYRAPEIMLSLIEYGAAVDMWSVGCIFAEMLARKHLFPGKDSISQIKLIIGHIGTPKKELLNLCQSPIIKNFITEMGVKEGIPLQKLFPKASKKALNLLSRMLVLHPGERITVERALVHPYLNKYHDPDDEPICVPVFNFDFEKEDLSIPQLRKVINTEIMEYHKPRTPTLSFNAFLKTVPKTPDTAKFPSKEPELKGTELLTASMKGEATVKKEQASISDKQGCSQHIVIPNQPEDEVFKRPLSAQNKDAKVYIDTASQLKADSTDIEMLSAKSTDSKQPMSATVTDEKTKENKDPGMEEKHKTISQDTKNLIKAAIMNESFKKRTDSISEDDRPRPITAAMRQKEREDKRKKKKEKTMERKRKEKKKKEAKDEILTSEDKELLQRWTKMHHANIPIAPKPPDPSAGVTGQGQSDGGQSGEGQGQNDKQAKPELPSFPTNQRNVQQGTLNLLQQRLLANACAENNNSNDNSVQTDAQAVIPDDHNMPSARQDNNSHNQQVFEDRPKIQVEPASTQQQENNGSGEGGPFSVDFSNVQLGDLDFLTMLSSPEVTSILTQSMPNEGHTTTANIKQFDDGSESLHLQKMPDHLASSVNAATLSSAETGAFLQHLCEGNSPINTQLQSDTQQPKQSSNQLSVSPNYPNHVSPPQFFAGHSPGSQHSLSPNHPQLGHENLSVSPNHNISPNFHFQPLQTQPQQRQLQQTNAHPSTESSQTAFSGQHVHTHATNMPFHNDNTSIDMNNMNPSNLFMSASQGHQGALSQSNQAFGYRNQSTRHTELNSSSNSNSNSPPALSINVQEAQMSMRQLFNNEPVAGPSQGSHNIQDTQVDLVALLSKQLSRSNVEDLCPQLALTPRGTGGGYGVGVDLDALMLATQDQDGGQPAEPSPLSSSILADWMEVTGNMNIDMDALEQELQSPMALSYNDLNLYSS